MTVDLDVERDSERLLKNRCNFGRYELSVSVIIVILGPEEKMVKSSA